MSCAINRIFWFSCFLHRALWCNYATWTNEMCTFQNNTLIQFFNFWRFLRALNHPEDEPWGSKHAEDVKNWKIEISINLKSVHVIGSCCIRIFWHYGQRKQTSLRLIPISLLFDDSCKGRKGTCPSDLAIVLSGRHDTHLVTLSSMSVAQ